MAFFREIRAGLAFVAAAGSLVLDAKADCTCRALGRNVPLGEWVCLSTAAGPRLAVCNLVLNNTSWRVSNLPCVIARGEGAESSADPLHGADEGQGG
jgi:hypothetical protein